MLEAIQLQVTLNQTGKVLFAFSRRVINDWKKMKANNFAMFLEKQVRGRLKYLLKEWKLITQDKWVLSVLKEGYKLEFIQKPKFLGIKETYQFPMFNQKICEKR